MISNKDKVLDISVNLARVSDWILTPEKKNRVDQFMEETKQFVDELSKENLSDRFKPTFEQFKKEFVKLLDERLTADKEEWAEKALTWANILQHRSGRA
ncbi:MAG: hypothetical protein AAB521_04010 [Patescibacteria group bacterium]